MRSWGSLIAGIGVLVCLLNVVGSDTGDVRWSLLGLALAVTGAGAMVAERLGESRRD